VLWLDRLEHFIRPGARDKKLGGLYKQRTDLEKTDRTYPFVRVIYLGHAAQTDLGQTEQTDLSV